MNSNNPKFMKRKLVILNSLTKNNNCSLKFFNHHLHFLHYTVVHVISHSDLYILAPMAVWTLQDWGFSDLSIILYYIYTTVIICIFSLSQSTEHCIFLHIPG